MSVKQAEVEFGITGNFELESGWRIVAQPTLSGIYSVHYVGPKKDNGRPPNQVLLVSADCGIKNYDDAIRAGISVLDLR